MRIVHEFGIHPVVAVNRFPGDDRRRDRRCPRGLRSSWARSGRRSTTGSSVEARARSRLPRSCWRQPRTAPRRARSTRSTSRSRTRSGRSRCGPTAPTASSFRQPLPRRRTSLAEAGLDELPVCIAKTHLSLSHDPSLGGTPSGFTLPVRELRPYTGAGWIVALCGDMQTMPGLPAEPAAKRIDVDADGRVTGLR